MATLINSEAQFLQRAKDFKISDGMARNLKLAGLTTFGLLAYAHGQPGQALNDAAFDAWIAGNLDSAASLADSSGVKRLLFEAQTLVLAALKEQITSPESSVVKRVPAAERESRMAALRAQLTGLVLEGPLEPSHSLLDLCASMHQLNEVRYLAPEKCVSRTHEVLHQKQPTKQIDISADSLVVKEARDVPDSSVQSALQVQEALLRRGIALAFAGLVTHPECSRYVTALFMHLHREPPPGYNRCAVSQLVAADKAVWQKLLEENKTPRRTAAGNLPLDTELSAALHSYQVSFALLPLPSKGKGPSVKRNAAGKAEQDDHKVWEPPLKKQKGKGKQKGRGKPSVPAEIAKLGGVARNPNNENICFAFNCSGCSEAAEGARCRRGWHICTKCFGVHSIRTHDKSS